MINKIQQTTDFIRSQIGDFVPTEGIILGTGLASLVNEIVIQYAISYEQIPNFPISTVEYHSGKLIFGTLAGKNVICMQGRFHYYEGYSMQEVTFGVRVMKWLGIKRLFVSNAAGGLNPRFKVADLMILTDHISLFLPESPLRGANPPEFGERWPDMSNIYDRSLINRAIAVKTANASVHTGVYVSVQGPQLETRAEYKMLQMLGADAVGMSTVPEIIVAYQMGIKCFGISVITDMCLPETLEKADIQKIIAAATQAEPDMTLIMKELIK